MIEGYDLERDLAAIGRALSSSMPEAAIFYCGRALEVTSACAVAALALDASTQVFANLDTLERLSCISRPALYFGHALRRLANDARHVLRPLTERDADFAALCLGPWLRWYARDYFRGPRMAISDDRFNIRSPLATGPVAATLDLLNRATNEDVCEPLLLLSGDETAQLPALAALVAEILISHNRMSEAWVGLSAALAHTPADLRLNQLQALCLRRSGHLDEALALLQSLSDKCPEDEETLGIAAGAQKSSWETSKRSEDALAQALRLYRRGFQVSRGRNLYLGVNAAAIELWQHNPKSREHAQRIVEQFVQRRAQLDGGGVDAAGQRDYYDIVTEAEARLLSGQGEAARGLYSQAFARFAPRQGDIEGTKAQANRSIALLGGEPIT